MLPPLLRRCSLPARWEVRIEMSWPGQQYSNCEMDPPVSELISYGSVSRLEQTMFAERLLEAGVLLPAWHLSWDDEGPSNL